MTDDDIKALRDLCESAPVCDDPSDNKHDISQWDVADVYRDLRRFHELAPILLAERDALRVGMHLLAARLDDLSRRAAGVSGGIAGVAGSIEQAPAKTKIQIVCSECNWQWSGPGHKCPPGSL